MHQLIRACLAVLGVLATCGIAGAASAPDAPEVPDFRGWQGMRVIRQEGFPARMIAADLYGEGRDAIVVINTRQSRLDIYRWVPSDKREKPVAADPDRPNELPMAPDWKKDELALDDLPTDVVAVDLKNDKKLSLVILATPANKIHLYSQGKDNKWERVRTWDLLPGAVQGERPILLRKIADGKYEAMVTFDQGVQTVTLDEKGRAAWLTPREQRGRVAWRLADMTGTGREDLIEWTSQARQSIRWYPYIDGRLQPAQVLHDQSVQGWALLPPTEKGKPAQLLLLGGSQEGLIRRYVLAQGDEAPLGKVEVLPMPGAKSCWTGLKLGDALAMVSADSGQPKLRAVTLGPTGWQNEQTYPSVSNVRNIAAVPGKPGTLLLWARDAADLHESHWENGRLTYPKVMPQSPDVQDRRILNLDIVGPTTWWVQRVGEHLDLYVWSPGADAPQMTRFNNVGAKADKVAWAGGKRLLVQMAYGTGAKLVIDDNGKTVITEPTHLSKVELGEFQLIDADGKLRLARLIDGVLQWLGDDLQPTDQIMLGEGQKLASYVPIGNGEAWALEVGGGYIHRLKPDSAGVPRVADTYKMTGGGALMRDPVLGIILTEADRVSRLSAGRPWQLKLVSQPFDSRVARSSGVRETSIHRITTLSVTRPGLEDVLCFDDRKHQLTLFMPTEESLVNIFSFQVFEDTAYPYGDRGGDRGLQFEPRAVVSLDAQGTGKRDLAMLCHDRLIIYLAREVKP